MGCSYTPVSSKHHAAQGQNALQQIKWIVLVYFSDIRRGFGVKRCCGLVQA
jgi:hypothetical protein